MMIIMTRMVFMFFIGAIISAGRLARLSHSQWRSSDMFCLAKNISLFRDWSVCANLRRVKEVI